MRSRFGPTALSVLIVAAGLAVYANSCSGPFIIDDLPAIVENPDVRHWGGWWETIAVSLNSTISGRPLMWLTLRINYALHGLSVWGYHAVNVALHLVCMLLSFGIIRRTLELPYWNDRFGKSDASWIAAAVTILWGIHPLLTETVVYISQRMELLAGVFYLLTLYACIRGWQSGSRSWFLAAVASTAIGLLAKEQVASAPVAALIYDCVFISGNLRQAIRRHARLYAGLVAAWSVFFVLTAYGPRSAAVGFDLGMSSAEYLRTQAGVLVHYLRLAFWPDPLCVSYADWPVEQSWARSAPPGIFILLLLGATVVLLLRRSWIGFAGAWFFLILAPSSSFVPIITEIAAERRMYLPMLSIVALAVAAGVWLHHCMRLRWSPRCATAASASLFLLVAAASSVATIRRNVGFQTSEGILGATLAARPHDELARGALMQELALKGNLERVHSLYREGLDLDPQSQSVHYNWGECLALAGRTDEAIEAFRELVRVYPENDRARRRLGQLLLSRGRAAEAVDHLQAGLWEAPEYYAGYNNLGAALSSLGRDDDAVVAFRTALKLHPDFADAHYNLAGVYLKRKQWPQAHELLQRGVRIAPHDTAMRVALARALEGLGDRAGAIREYQAILRQDPVNAEVRLQLTRLQGRGEP